MKKNTLTNTHKVAMIGAVLAITYLAAGLTYLGANAAAPLYGITIDGDKTLTRGSRATYSITVTNNSMRASGITLEHTVTMPDFKSGKIPLSFIGTSSNVKCTATKTGASCTLGVVPAKGKVSLKLIYSVKECSPALTSTVQAGSNALSQYRSQAFSQLFEKCSLSDKKAQEKVNLRKR